MAGQIKTILDQRVDIEITQASLQAIITLVQRYETREDHPQALNTPYLGIHKAYFKDSDREALFNLFNTDTKAISGIVNENCKRNDLFFDISIKNFVKDFLKEIRQPNYLVKGITNTSYITSSELKTIISDITTVNSDFKVVSDPFNIFISYLIHKILNTNFQEILKHKAVYSLIMYLQYKFFTSLVNYRFRYTPSEQVMAAMYESLSDKYDIKTYGTWKALMEARAALFTDPKNSIHYASLKDYTDDKKIIYFISDVQTRIRNQVNAIYQEFQKAKELNDKIGTYSTTGKDKDDEKMINGVEQGFDLAIANVYNDTLSITRLLEDRNIKIVVGLYKNTNVTTFRSTLIRISEESVKQTKSGKADLIQEINGQSVIIGIHALIENIIQKSYRYCINNNVNLNSPLEIIKGVKDAYSSSRILDEGIARVNRSVEKIILDLKMVTRVASVASYRLGFITYIILLSFRYI